MDKENYVRMISKFHYIVCPPPVRRERVLEEAEKDWANDSAGAHTMEYDRFFDAIFQLCDIWTHSCEVKEYCALLERLIGGATRTESDGSLSWREDQQIGFDDFFAENADVVEEKMKNDLVVTKDLDDILVLYTGGWLQFFFLEGLIGCTRVSQTSPLNPLLGCPHNPGAALHDT